LLTEEKDWREEAKLNALSTSERAAVTNESLDYNDELKRGGPFLAAHALQDVSGVAFGSSALKGCRGARPLT
jgi:hypothetical protein